MWFKVDDKLRSNRKVARLGRRCPVALSVWVLAGADCGLGNTEGIVSADMLEDCAAVVGLSPGEGVEVADAIVAAGMWHDAKTLRSCEPCQRVVGKLPRGAFCFHDWLECNFTKDEAKLPEERRKRVRGRALSRDVVLRNALHDRDKELCRYCGVRVNFRDRVGARGGTYDHLNPSLCGVEGNTLANVVTACRECNGRKGERTPDEWVAEEGLWHPNDNPMGGRPLIPEEAIGR